MPTQPPPKPVPPADSDGATLVRLMAQIEAHWADPDWVEEGPDGGFEYRGVRPPIFTCEQAYALCRLVMERP